MRNKVLKYTVCLERVKNDKIIRNDTWMLVYWDQLLSVCCCSKTKGDWSVAKWYHSHGITDIRSKNKREQKNRNKGGENTKSKVSQATLLEISIRETKQHRKQ